MGKNAPLAKETMQERLAPIHLSVFTVAFAIND
jgi:hypothetical protein